MLRRNINNNDANKPVFLQDNKDKPAFLQDNIDIDQPINLSNAPGPSIQSGGNQYSGGSNSLKPSQETQQERLNRLMRERQ